MCKHLLRPALCTLHAGLYPEPSFPGRGVNGGHARPGCTSARQRPSGHECTDDLCSRTGPHVSALGNNADGTGCKYRQERLVVGRSKYTPVLENTHDCAVHILCEAHMGGVFCRGLSAVQTCISQVSSSTSRQAVQKLRKAHFSVKSCGLSSSPLHGTTLLLQPLRPGHSGQICDNATASHALLPAELLSTTKQGIAGTHEPPRCVHCHPGGCCAMETRDAPLYTLGRAQSAPVPRRAHRVVVVPLLYFLHIPRAVQHACSMQVCLSMGSM